MRDQMLTLDGIQYFPKTFIDLKSFYSNRAQAVEDESKDSESKEEKAKNPN